MQSSPSPLSFPPRSLAAAFAAAPDPRRAASVTYPLAAILALAVSAILANHHSVLAIAEWGARQSRELVIALGIADGRTPCQSTLHRLFRQLDGDALSAALTTCFAPGAAPAAGTADPQGIAIDGKAPRSRPRGAAGVRPN